MDMTKTAVKSALGLDTDAELARFFDTTRQAVDKWPDEKPIPMGRQWELRARRPDIFSTDELVELDGAERQKTG
ncbi:hypothetical protein [Lysobacter sp. ESA13C]|uniref:hypothetical protein n=1 Tax=Lysobacter sp. ESA13C TaxID=2862676 RepID=UPI001CBDCDBE|nr:hypothetical protein [Lysobacter sp. ESA13C]